MFPWQCGSNGREETDVTFFSTGIPPTTPSRGWRPTTDDGIHDIALLLTVHGLQCAFRRAKRVQWHVPQPVAVGRRRTVAAAAGGCRLHPVAPARIFDGE